MPFLSRFFNIISVANYATRVSFKSSPNAVEVYRYSNEFRINHTRCYFPRPQEKMRIRKHGWAARMSTEAGRKVLMNRILKGRHVLSH